MSNVKQYLITMLAFFMGLVGDVGNLLQMTTLENGWWWLSGLLAVAIGYKIREYVWDRWLLWRTSRSKLEQIRELLLSAQCGDIIRACALIYHIRRQEQAIHVRAVLGVDLVVIDVSRLALRSNDELKGTKWTLLSQNGSGQVQGEVVDCDGKQAYLQLAQSSSLTLQVGDLATLLGHEDATEVEQLAAKALCVIGG